MLFKNVFSHDCSLCLMLVIAIYGNGIGRTLADELGELSELSESNQRAAEWVHALQQDPSVQLLDVLSAMKDTSAVAKNWYLSLAQTVADRNPQVSKEQLQQFYPRLSEDSTARYWAFEYVTRGDRALREQLLESMLADPCLELRYEAVELGLSRLKAAELDDQATLARYRELLAAARLPSQIQDIATRMKEECHQEVDLLEHMGFLTDWRVVGPFDNVGQAGFNVVYGPESEYAERKLTDGSKYQGKSDVEIAWRETSTEAVDGAVDLNELFENAKGAIVYALANFACAEDVECEVRIGSPNACQVWVNGQRLISREVYHAGNQIDQYVAPVFLGEGVNTILVKVCQNEQTETWAQDWRFQLRFTDSSGLPIRPGR